MNTNMNKKEKFYLNAFGVVEIILLLVIIIGLVLIFKGEIEQLITNAVNSLTGKAERII